jgi:hypothetical protein
MAMSRRLALFGQFTSYRSDIPAGSTVWSSPARLSRYLFTAGLTIWAPLVSRQSRLKEVITR